MAFESKRVETAPILKHNRATVNIAPELEEPLKAALYGWSDEFIVFLEGTRDGRFVDVTGIFVPEQHNNSTTCESLVKFDPDQWMGIGHSHVDMGAWHSCTDEKGVDMAPVSLVFSRNKQHGIDIVGKVAVELPCGCVGVMLADVGFGVENPKAEWVEPETIGWLDELYSDCPHVACNIDLSLLNAIHKQTKPEPKKTYGSTYTTGTSNGTSKGVDRKAADYYDDYNRAVGYGGWAHDEWGAEQCFWCNEWEDTEDMTTLKSGSRICNECAVDIPTTAVIAE